jgi:hypothetical protein
MDTSPLALPDDRLPRPAAGGVLLLALVLAAAAVWWLPWAPLVDWPNHMARHYLEARRLAGHELPPFYAVDYHLVPNLGADLVLPPLIVALGPDLASRGFLLLSLVLFWGGAALFLAECWEWGVRAQALALLLVPWVLCNPFFWGFLNFYSGLGLAFVALAHFLHLYRAERPPVLGLVLHAGLVALLFAWHLAAWGTYGVVLVCRLLAGAAEDWRREHRLGPALRRALPFVVAVIPSLVLYAIFSRAQSSTAPSAGFNWGGVTRKARLLLTPCRAYDGRVDALVAVLWLAAAALMFGGPGRRERSPGWLVLGVLAFLGLYVVLPYQLGTTSDADSRALMPLLLLAIALLGTLPLRRPGLALGLVALSVLLRYGSVIVAWDAFGPRLQALARSFPHLPQRGRVLPVVLAPTGSKDHPEEHFLDWAVLTRQIYTPGLFADPGQHTLVRRGPVSVVARPSGEGYILPSEGVVGSFDVLWVYNPYGKHLKMPDEAEKTYEAGPVSIWRLP